MSNKVSNQQIEAFQTGEPTEVKLTVAIAPPSNLEPALAGVPGNINNGDHRYALTFVLDGETTRSPEMLITVTDKTVDGQVDMTQIPVGPEGTTARKIYRTEANLLVYKLLTTIEDNTTTEFTDNIADASLGAEAPAVNTTKLGMIRFLQGVMELVVDPIGGIGSIVLGDTAGACQLLVSTDAGGIGLRAEGTGIFFEGTSLPTLDPEQAGQLWNEDGFVRISAG